MCAEGPLSHQSSLTVTVWIQGTHTHTGTVTLQRVTYRYINTCGQREKKKNVFNEGIEKQHNRFGVNCPFSGLGSGVVDSVLG